MKTVHLICNAHLDPMWLWQWQEGAAEAISTFRVAADFCERFDGFVFNHNEVILYQWVHEYEPALFKRIQELVKAGKWHIMGGWYLQPDCNMPSGESFVRQILLGRAYFKKHFGVEPTTAINFDPFGHTRGLVQILAKSGYDSYLFGRPTKPWTKIPAEDFKWIGYDGSEIHARRFIGWYNTPYGKATEAIKKRISECGDAQVSAVLWGVGNHGGGPSECDLMAINEMISETTDCKIIHSTPEAYFSDFKKTKETLPAYKGDLNSWGVGCYTSQVRIKQQHRLLENELYVLEKMAVNAAIQDLMVYPREEIHQALCDLMVAQFHDILPGSSIHEVEKNSLCLMDHALEIISRLKARAFFALANGQKKAKPNEIPVLVYNPHPFKIKQLVECEFSLADYNFKGNFTQIEVFSGKTKLLSQVEEEQSNLPFDWRKHVVFMAQLKPGMNRFDCRPYEIDKKPLPTIKIKNDRIVFKTDDLEVVVNCSTGLIDRYRVKGTDYLKKNAFELLVIADNEDSWGTEVLSFRDAVGVFKLMNKKESHEFSGIKRKINAVRVIEDNDARSIIEAVFSYGKSSICQRYKLPKLGTEIEIEIFVYWNQKDKMLKLSVPTKSGFDDYIGQVAYGVADLPTNGDEAVAQKWVSVVSKNKKSALTCINDGVYGSDFSSDGLRLTLLRSPVYSCFPSVSSDSPPQDRFTPRIDQGERHFRFWFNAGSLKERMDLIDREALVKNEKVEVLSFFPSGQGIEPKPFATLSDSVVQIAAVKFAEQGDDVIVRLFEPTGKKRSTTLTIPCFKIKKKISMGAFEIKTLKINALTKKIIEVNLCEGAISKKQ